MRNLGATINFTLPEGSDFPEGEESELFRLKGHPTLPSGIYHYMDNEWVLSGASAVNSVIQIKNIGGQELITYVDTTRNKLLSVDYVLLTFGSASISNDTWLGNTITIGTNSGYVMPINGTMVFITGHAEDGGDTNIDISVYVAGVETTGVLNLNEVTGVAVSASSTSVNIDFNAGDLIQLRSRRISGGKINDITLVCYVKWRAAL